MSGRTPADPGPTWADIVRQTLDPASYVLVPNDVEDLPELGDARRFTQPAPATPTRHDRPAPVPERHERRTQL